MQAASPGHDHGAELRTTSWTDRPADIAVSYGERDCIVYALGIGIGMEPLDPGALKFVYERAGLEAFPTMAVVLGWPGRLTDPAFGVDERLVVAGDLKVMFHRPLAAHAQLTSRPRIKEVIDKGAGNAAIILNTRELIGADGAPVATVDSSTFARKHGGFGGKVTETPAPPAVPQREPDRVCDLPNAHPTWRCSTASTGTRIRLHADPERAKAAGFERPILHGAASFGVAAHAVVPATARGLSAGTPRRDRSPLLAAGFSRRYHPHRDVVAGRARLFSMPCGRTRRHRAQQRPCHAAVLITPGMRGRDNGQEAQAHASR